MIDFHRIRLADKEQYESHLINETERGCEYSFANLYLWGRQEITYLHGCTVIFSHFYGRSVYPFPVGGGDKEAVIHALIQDAEKRGIPCRISGLTSRDMDWLEERFPGRFSMRCNRNSFDYVYTIDALADLRGRKLQKKRNHFNRFQLNHPDYQIIPLDSSNLSQAKAMTEQWYARRQETDPQGDYVLEKRALDRAFQKFEGLRMEGILLMDNGEVLAVTMGSRLSADTFDIHFEKAREDVDGAYPAINCEFARYLRLKYPDVKFLNREDDMGLEGLRKAKLSYYPDHLVEKCWAYLTEDAYED